MHDFKRIKEFNSELWPMKWILSLIVCGYLTGIGLVLLWYKWHPTQRKRDLTQLWLLYVLLALLCTTMIFSRSIRCIFALALPSLSSSRGRAFLVTLAFVLAAMGPTANIMVNVMAMLRSIACGQELLRQALGQMMDVVLEPARAVQSAVELLLEELRRVLRQVMEVLLRIQGYLLIIIDTLKACTSWLKSVVELCNSKEATPYKRCQKAAEHAMTKCRQKLGIFKAICHATKLFLAICYPAKLVDILCTGFWDASWDLLDTILERYHAFVAQLEIMFDASISFEHKFSFHTNASKNLSDVGEDIVQDIKDRMGPFILLQGWLDLVCWLMLFAVFFKSIYFYIRYMTSLRYKNIFITSAFYDVNKEWEEQGEIPFMPLKRVERIKYLKLTGCRLTKYECLSLAKSSFFMIITCVQLSSICLVDYSLFWLLDTIAYYGEQQDDMEIPAYIDLDVRGGGFVGDIIRGIVEAFRPLTQKTTLDSKSCLPDPVEPDYSTYIKILLLCLIAWLILFIEPYTLRLRHLIMQRFYPERARERARFLHRKILADRDSFFKFARRKARAAFRYNQANSHRSCFSWLKAKLLWCCCCLCLMKESRDVCIICAKALSSSNRIQCDTEGCPGIFCESCFTKSKKKCCLCQRPIDYGDQSDISEVEDSSDDPEAESYTQLQARLYNVNCRKQV